MQSFTDKLNLLVFHVLWCDSIMQLLLGDIHNCVVHSSAALLVHNGSVCVGTF